jgi:hypothetical protein
MRYGEDGDDNDKHNQPSKYRIGYKWPLVLGVNHGARQSIMHNCLGHQPPS